MPNYTLDQQQLVRRPLEDVFAFFASPENLQHLTPPFLDFRILTPVPIEMREGALIEYRISVRGIPLRWQTRIESYEPMRSFVDVQLRGPYRLWRHTHTFEATAEGTVVRDHVEYALPFGPLGQLVHALMVKRDLAQIFAYRRAVIAQLLERP
jgi:ligand-binding SRPBCC domain-containing protein